MLHLHNSPEDVKVPPSLSYHLADIYLEELDKALAASSADESESSPVAPAPLSTFLDPFFALTARTTTKTTVQRLESALLEPLFDALDAAAVSPATSQSQAEDEDEETSRSRKRPRLAEPAFPHVLASCCLVDSEAEGALGVGAVRKGLLKRLFAVASEERTRDANRRKMYKFVKARDDDGDEDEGTE